MELHLSLAIVVLLLLLRALGVPAGGIVTAVFSCLTAPAVYAMAYYRVRAYAAGRFVRLVRPGLGRLWVYEVAGLVSSYAVGYLVYASLGGGSLGEYTVGYASVQVMRVVAAGLKKVVEGAGLDPDHPVAVLLVSLAAAGAGLAAVLALLSLVTT